jgi:hypothetical protein
MKLDMNFSFDTSVPNDGEVMQKVCAVLSGAPVETVFADTTEKKVVIVPDEIVGTLQEKVEEAVKENIAEEAAANPEPEEQATEVVIDPMTSSEDDMMKVSTDLLLKILKGLKIDPNATEGKNTNAKLRRLILDWRKTQTSAPATTEDDDDEQDEAPAATTAKKMTYDEAKIELGPYFVNTKCSKYGTWRAGCQEFMKQHGACVEVDGVKTPKLSALGDADYTPLVNAIKSFYKL